MSYIDLIGMLAVICIGAMIILGGAVLWFAGSMQKKMYPLVITYDQSKTNIFGNYVVQRVERENTIESAEGVVGWTTLYAIVIIAGSVIFFGG